YRIQWPTGKDSILLISVGTGAADPPVRRSEIAAAHALRSLLSLMEDCAALQEIMLQWMSQSTTARKIDGELEILADDLLTGAQLLTYARYNVELGAVAIQELLGDGAKAMAIDNLSAMDAPENMKDLHEICLAAGKARVKSEHFPYVFDLN